jgi:hypothetical protein
VDLFSVLKTVTFFSLKKIKLISKTIKVTIIVAIRLVKLKINIVFRKKFQEIVSLNIEPTKTNKQVMAMIQLNEC